MSVTNGLLRRALGPPGGGGTTGAWEASVPLDASPFTLSALHARAHVLDHTSGLSGVLPALGKKRSEGRV
ncbi:hypothetical protein [Gemmatimonas sp.]|uniref:hypothetical protein n=1 Tax=Gemmatimonas sp. TaxID=1962908 RepID=UPI003564DC90